MMGVVPAPGLAVHLTWCGVFVCSHVLPDNRASKRHCLPESQYAPGRVVPAVSS